MKVKNYWCVLCIICICLSFYVFADSGSTSVNNYLTNTTVNGTSPITEFNCTGKNTSSLVIKVDPYISVNTTDVVYAYYWNASSESINETGTQAVLVYNNQSYNMSYIKADDAWEILLYPTDEEYIEFYVSAYAPSYLCKNASASTFGRISYYLTIHLYKGATNTSDTNPVSYKNDFQYVFLQFANDTYGLKSYSPRDLNYLDKWFGWVPYYPTSGVIATSIDTEMAFWDSYSDGVATIKLYEIGNYSVFLMSTDVTGVGWSDEFTYPQYDEEAITNTIKNQLQITEKKDYTIDIYLSAWDVFQFNLWMNLAKWAGIILVWFCLTIASIMTRNTYIIIGFQFAYWTALKTLQWLL